MGAVSASIARSALASGAEIVTESPVRQIVIDNGTVEGVQLESGKMVKSKIVLSNATPHRTFVEMCESRDLPEEFLSAVKGINYKSPVTKINVAVDRLPNFLANPNSAEGQVMPHHRSDILRHFQTHVPTVWSSNYVLFA